VIRIKSCRLRNWLSVEETSLTFPSQGVVVVLGSNLAGRGKLESVGSGKSALGEALGRSLLGIEGRFATLGHYSRKEEGDTYVVVEAELDNGQPLKVELGYKCHELSRTGEGLRFSIGDAAPIERAHVRDTRAELTAAVGITPLVADWTVFLDGERLKFNRLSQTEALDLLMQSLSQPAWQSYHELAKKKQYQADSLVTAAVAKVEAARQHLRQAEASVTAQEGKIKLVAEEYERSRAGYEQKRKAHEAKVKEISDRISAFKIEKKAARAEIDRVTAMPAEDPETTAEIARLNAESKTIGEFDAGWKVELSRAQSELAAASHELSHMLSMPDACPTCKRAWDRRPSKEEIAAKKAQVSQLKTEQDEARKQLDGCHQELGGISKKISQLRRDLELPRKKLLEPLNAALRKIEDDLELDEDALESLGRVAPREPVDTRASAQAVLESQREHQASSQKSLNETAEKAAEAERIKLLAKYWVTAFSPAGLPNMALRTVIPPLNEASKTIGNTMTGGVLSVVFEGSTELASGQAKPQLVTKVHNEFGASRMNGNSKGEAGLANLIIAETQAEVGQVAAKIGFRWFDEAVNSEDPVVRRNIYQYLKRQAAERQILIFVVDHNPEAVHFADHILIANKSAEGTTTFAWR
jgi:DNA repair exonuclease SbcCD ATPase subunit